MRNTPGYSIGVVSTRTGLSTHVIRAWERRYKAVTPARSASGRRIYSQEDIDQLIMLKRLTKSGIPISHIAGLESEALAQLASRTIVPNRSSPTGEEQPVVTESMGAKEMVDQLLKAVSSLDIEDLHHLLEKALSMMSRQAMLRHVVTPFMESIGRQWVQGSLRILHGQIAATAVHALLSNMLLHCEIDAPERPLVLTATPAGQSCYLGAMTIALIARDQGWESIFLGPNLPGEEIVAARRILSPQLIALSITCRVNDAFMNTEFKRVSNLRNDNCPIVIGGQASGHYRQMWEATGGKVCSSTGEFVRLLA